ncbi:hypothetical protein Lgee_2014 [Legionella geestiana]|uniref:Uncharacterized protein n=1 Tax=Legionella geestiana TaxID=45065 RepID=A0A0W0TP61_9GAMM|nr:hypothetical protein [Legionella geestiana]KTC97353.1 hypothetical protein Lgee_2014 [Legionella geestiana]QBS12477.1 hypothetical protein E4T54_06785 [Legionella geestiana]QDQ39808.1 hypothetical protein E3226_005075 [Legionella geestiana]STX55079.1 Uncharacterised protein [Legionella geestiana]
MTEEDLEILAEQLTTWTFSSKQTDSPLRVFNSVTHDIDGERLAPPVKVITDALKQAQESHAHLTRDAFKQQLKYILQDSFETHGENRITHNPHRFLAHKKTADTPSVTPPPPLEPQCNIL